MLSVMKSKLFSHSYLILVFMSFITVPFKEFNLYALLETVKN